jgi:hypothetical protein
MHLLFAGNAVRTKYDMRPDQRQDLGETGLRVQTGGVLPHRC